MRTTIDRLGRVVVPKAIRDRLGLRGGEAFEILERDGAIELRPQPADVTVIETAEGPVASPRAALPPLTDELVRDTLERSRR